MSESNEKTMRTCVGCGEHFEKQELMRIVRSDDGTISYDPTGRAAGRGAYVCSLGCLDMAVKTNRLQKALRADVSEEEVARIVLDVVEAMR